MIAAAHHILAGFLRRARMMPIAEQMHLSGIAPPQRSCFRPERQQFACLLVEMWHQILVLGPQSRGSRNQYHCVALRSLSHPSRSRGPSFFQGREWFLSLQKSQKRGSLVSESSYDGESWERLLGGKSWAQVPAAQRTDCVGLCWPGGVEPACCSSAGSWGPALAASLMLRSPPYLLG